MRPSGKSLRELSEHLAKVKTALTGKPSKRRLPHHGKGGSAHIGRTRIAAAEILTKHFGFLVEPEDIVPTTGAWRTDWRLDVYRWELFTHKGSLPVIRGCWTTLTEFVRFAKKYGVEDDGHELDHKTS